MKTKKKKEISKGKKREKTSPKARPKNVWNSLRKLEICLKKSTIQANIFAQSLEELRDSISLENKTEIVKKLCSSVNGDILHALLSRKEQENMKEEGEYLETDALAMGVFDVLANTLNLTPFKKEGERFFLPRESTREYDFNDHPESLNDERIRQFEVEVLRPGWKIGNSVVIKPVVYELGSGGK